jgi:hypothetical protein
MPQYNHLATMVTQTIATYLKNLPDRREMERHCYRPSSKKLHRIAKSTCTANNRNDFGK